MLGVIRRILSKGTERFSIIPSSDCEPVYIIVTESKTKFGEDTSDDIGAERRIPFKILSFEPSGGAGDNPSNLMNPPGYPTKRMAGAPYIPLAMILKTHAVATPSASAASAESEQ